MELIWRKLSDGIPLTVMMACGCVTLLMAVFSVHATEYTQTLTSEERTPGISTNWPGDSTEDMHHNCPGFLDPLAERGLRGGFTTQCEAILDQKFLDQILPWTPIYAKDHTITWRYVLDHPLAKRKIVLATLDDPACVFTGDHPTSDELADRCNANVIADYAALKYACTGGLPRVLRFIENGFEVPSYLSTFERIFDSDSYWEKRWRLEYGYYRHAWVAAKCDGIPDEAFVSLGEFENTMNLGGSPATGEEDWWWIEQGSEAYQLMRVADRLSNNLTRTEYGYERKNLSSWQLVDPVIVELLKVKNPGAYSNTAEEKAARLKHFIAALTWIKMKQVDVDQNWLLRQIGEFSDEDLEQAANDANAMMAKQGVGKTWF